MEVSHPLALILAKAAGAYLPDTDSAELKTDKQALVEEVKKLSPEDQYQFELLMFCKHMGGNAEHIDEVAEKESNSMGPEAKLIFVRGLCIALRADHERFVWQPK